MRDIPCSRASWTAPAACWPEAARSDEYRDALARAPRRRALLPGGGAVPRAVSHLRASRCCALSRCNTTDVSLEVDETVGPGFVAEALDGSVVVDNTLAARLARMRAPARGGTAARGGPCRRLNWRSWHGRARGRHASALPADARVAGRVSGPAGAGTRTGTAGRRAASPWPKRRTSVPSSRLSDAPPIGTCARSAAGSSARPACSMSSGRIRIDAACVR